MQTLGEGEIMLFMKLIYITGLINWLADKLIK